MTSLGRSTNRRTRATGYDEQQHFRTGLGLCQNWQLTAASLPFKDSFQAPATLLAERLAKTD